MKATNIVMINKGATIKEIKEIINAKEDEIILQENTKFVIDKK